MTDKNVDLHRPLPFVAFLMGKFLSSSTIDGSMRMKTSSEPTSPLSPEVFPYRAFIKEGHVQLSTVSVFKVLTSQRISDFKISVWIESSLLGQIRRKSEANPNQIKTSRIQIQDLKEALTEIGARYLSFLSCLDD